METSPTRNKNSERGMALIIVIGAMVILTVLATELFYSVSIDRRLAGNLKEGLRAYYLAKSAVRFSIWRLHFYMGLVNDKSIPPDGRQYINLMWNLPLPPLPIDPKALGLSELTGSELLKFKNETTSQGTFSAAIKGEGAKIAINLLTGDPAWGSNKDIQQATKAAVLQLIQQDYENDRDFSDAHRDFVPEAAVNAIIDYIDVDDNPIDSLSAETDYYSRLDPPRKAKNMPLFSLEELRFIRYWDDEIFRRYSKHFSQYTTQFYINVNTADEKLLKAIGKQPNEEAFQEFLQKRTEKPFTKVEDFTTAFKAIPGVPDDFDKHLLLTVDERTFFIEALGQSGDSTSKHEVAVRLESKPAAPCDPATNPECEKKNKELPALNFLRIVYWKESYL